MLSNGVKSTDSLSRLMDRLTALYVLTHIEGFGMLTVRRLLESSPSPIALFQEPESLVDFSCAVRQKLALIARDKGCWLRAERELESARKKGLQIIDLYSEHYPRLLAECVDAPPLLFLRGELQSLSCEHLISIVGTRSSTHYGRHVVFSIVEALHSLFPDLVVVSGIALGIDTAAHEAALAVGAGTIGVMAHGHDSIYPAVNAALYRKIAQSEGGLLSEYTPSVTIERHRFVARNRIIAGLSSGTLIVESDEKGGALRTVALADDYYRTVMAIPGRLTDRYSRGCNRLIAHQKALAVTSVEDIVEALGWQQKEISPLPLGKARELPEHPILQLIAQSENIHFNKLIEKSQLSSAELAAQLIDLELEGYVMALPGGHYSLTLT